MGHLSIHCDGCGSDWTVYHRDDWKDWKARTCPVCGAEINPQTWEKFIMIGFGEMEDANIELVKDHTQLHGALFTVSYIPDVFFPNRSEGTNEIREELEELKTGVVELGRIVRRILGALFENNEGGEI